MTKTTYMVVGAVAGLLVVSTLMFLLWPFIYDHRRSTSLTRTLQNRSDYPEIAKACVSLAHSDTNEFDIAVTDPRVPALLRSLSPTYITVAPDEVTMEFHGGFDHYGYRVRQSTTNASQWTIYYYTEEGEKSLTTVELSP